MVPHILADVSSIGAALIGVGGTVVGGATTIVGQLLIERGRAKRERDRAAAADLAATRASARLMQADFHRANTRLSRAAVSRVWWAADSKLRFLVEMKDRRLLADHLPPGDFTIVVRAETTSTTGSSVGSKWNPSRGSTLKRPAHSTTR
jgi:hypothetical protein